MRLVLTDLIPSVLRDGHFWGGALGLAASAVAVIAAVRAFEGLARRWWRRSLGARRHQQALIDQLVCLESMAYVRQFLGEPVFTQPLLGGRELLYRLPGSWVWILSVNDSVMAFGVTVTKRRMFVRTDWMSAGQLKLKLGRSTFGTMKATSEASSARFVMGARNAWYDEEYYFGNPGNPGNHLTYVVSYNDLGAAGGDGFVDHRGASLRQFSNGNFSGFPYEATDEKQPRPPGLTANTIAVIGPEIALSDLVAATQYRPLGAQYDVVRAFRGAQN
jgi:hypothetical protein